MQISTRRKPARVGQLSTLTAINPQGLWLSRLLSLFGDTEARILVLGLDNAGKTTILCECFARAPKGGATVSRPSLNLHLHPFADRLHVGEVVQTIPSEVVGVFMGGASIQVSSLHRAPLAWCPSLPPAITLHSQPTAIGFNVETVTYKNIKFQVWDLGGQTSIRPYWRCYYP